jgi:homocysteine S-methyltransferase
MPDFREALSSRVILFDGAMGTELYAHGVFINRCYDELNLASPELVREIHASYRQAGADVLTTNSFGANPIRLAAFGLESRMKEINAQAARLARQEARDRCFVAGSMGPTGATLAPLGKLTPGEAFCAFKEQATVLAESGVDLIVLETFTRLGELWQAVRAVKAVCDLPIVACMSFGLIGPSQTQIEGDSPEECVHAVENWGVDAFGTNCSNGPRGVQHVLERLLAASDIKLATMPNAGLPQVVDGRTLYLAAPEYMAEYARRFVQLGASIVGGCCGTTPLMIKEMSGFIRSVSADRRLPQQEVTLKERPSIPPKHPSEKSIFGKKLYSGKFCVSVELEPPRGTDPLKALEGAEILKSSGVDVVNIADGPRAVARMGPSSLAQLVRQHCGMEAIVHYCCRDRNLLGMQMDLLGAHALGLHNILAITGDPPKMGTYPNATAVFDIDAIGLITFIQMLNRGLDFSGQPIGGQTALLVGAGCNPAHIDLELEVDRYRRKVEAGAEYFFSQPVFDSEILFRFFEKTKDVRQVPFLVGIMPLASSKNAEFLHNEVPGMQVPERIRARLKEAGDREAQREVGIEVAREALIEVTEHPRVTGTYVFPPFGSYRAVLRVLEVVRERMG